MHTGSGSSRSKLKRVPDPPQVKYRAEYESPDTNMELQTLELDSKKLGHRLRELRVRRGLSLVDAAAAADMSPSFLSHVETGKGDITFLRMHRLVRAYGIGLMDLLPPVHALPEVVRAKERVPLRSSTEGISMYLLAPDASRAMTPVYGRLEPGAAEAEFGHFSNELFIHVVQGALKIIFEGGREIELRAGDSAYLDSQEGRKTANASRGVTLTIGVALWPKRPTAKQKAHRVSGQSA